eukprot:gene18433-5771_t
MDMQKSPSRGASGNPISVRLKVGSLATSVPLYLAASAILMWLVVGAAGFAYTVRVLGEISTDYCERRVFPNGTIYEVHPQRGHCKWSWQYSTFFDVIEGILSGFGALCMWARAYFLYKKRVVLAHKALKYGCALAGLAALYMAASPLSLPGIYQVGGPDAVLAQW